MNSSIPENGIVYYEIPGVNELVLLISLSKGELPFTERPFVREAGLPLGPIYRNIGNRHRPS